MTGNRPGCPDCGESLLRATGPGWGLLPSGEHGHVTRVTWICGTPSCHPPAEPKRRRIPRGVAALIAAVVLVGAFALARVASAQSWPAEADQYRDLWAVEWDRCGLRDVYEPWMLGQVTQESRWRKDAVSPVGAIGLAQVMPKTNRDMRTVYPGQFDALEGGPDEPQVAFRALCVLTLEGLRANGGAPTRKVRWRWAAYIYNGGYYTRREQRDARADGVDPWNHEVVRPRYCPRHRSAAACHENIPYPDHAFKHARLFEGY